MAEDPTHEPLPAPPSPSRLVFRVLRAVVLSWLAAVVLSLSLVIVAVDQMAAIFGLEPAGRAGIFAGAHRAGVAMARTAWGDLRALWTAAVTAARPLVAEARAAIRARGWLR